MTLLQPIESILLAYWLRQLTELVLCDQLVPHPTCQAEELDEIAEVMKGADEALRRLEVRA